MSNMKKVNVSNKDHRTELHDLLSLTGAEVSINNLGSNESSPFVHSHKNNEEIYIITSGSGELYLDGNISDIKANDCFAIKPSGKRAFKAGSEGLSYICIQVKEGSLEGYTFSDGIINDEKTPWQE